MKKVAMLFLRMIIIMLQMIEGDYLYVYDVKDHSSTKMIKEWDMALNQKKKTVSSKVGHSLLIRFSSDYKGNGAGFSAFFHYFPHNANCDDFLDETKLDMTQAINCNWIITAPSTASASTITIQFHYFEVQYGMIRFEKKRIKLKIALIKSH